MHGVVFTTTPCAWVVLNRFKRDEMTDSEKYLLENGIDNIVLNADEFTENTPENAGEWIYLSEVLTQFAQEQGSKLPMHDVMDCEHPPHKRQYLGRGVLRCSRCGQEFS